MTAVERMVRDVSRLLNRDRPPEQNIADALAHCAKVTGRARIPRPPAPGKSKGTRKAEHRASTATLRDQVWERCGGRCEVSGSWLGAAWELHHVQGAGLRRSRQRPGNVLAVSYDVHRLIHRGDLDMLRRIAAAPSLDAEARRAAQRRVDKVLEARGVAVEIVVKESA